jgi:uncharacterized protein (UPF0332 family)
VKEMGKILNKAFEKRQIGDYEYDFVISEDDAKDILINGKEFVQTIIHYLGINGDLVENQPT